MNLFFYFSWPSVSGVEKVGEKVSKVRVCEKRFLWRWPRWFHRKINGRGDHRKVYLLLWRWPCNLINMSSIQEQMKFFWDGYVGKWRTKTKNFEEGFQLMTQWFIKFGREMMKLWSLQKGWALRRNANSKGTQRRILREHPTVRGFLLVKQNFQPHGYNKSRFITHELVLCNK